MKVNGFLFVGFNLIAVTNEVKGDTEVDAALGRRRRQQREEHFAGRNDRTPACRRSVEIAPQVDLRLCPKFKIYEEDLAVFAAFLNNSTNRTAASASGGGAGFLGGLGLVFKSLDKAEHSKEQGYSCCNVDRRAQNQCHDSNGANQRCQLIGW